MFFKESFSVKKGFTIIEVLIVMVLMGLSISIVIPNIARGYDKIKFRGEAKKFYELVQKIKFHAFYYQQNVTLSSPDRRLAVQGMALAADEIPDLPVDIKGEILFSSNGISSGGEIYLYYKETPKVVIRIESFSGRTSREFL
jgi:prepilin-type N-terminal cleavage/methylation domain-containing protein